jgi:hypothetical protein
MSLDQIAFESSLRGFRKIPDFSGQCVKHVLVCSCFVQQRKWARNDGMKDAR